MKERSLAAAPKDTVTSIVVVPHVLPKPVLTPNPAPAKPRLDLTLKDSVETLIATIANKDSLIRDLMSTTGTEQRFVSKDPTGLDVSGTLTIVHSPLEHHFLTQIELDTIRVTDRIITIHEPPIIEEVIRWEWVAEGIVGGIIIGALLAQ